MFQAAQQAGISPLRLGFTGTLKVIRRAISDFQDVPLEELPFFFTKLITDILAEKIPPRIGRSNPRVVKKPRSKFSSKQPIHRHTGSTRQRLNFFISNIQRRGVARYSAERLTGGESPTRLRGRGEACPSTYLRKVSIVTPPQLATKYEPLQKTGLL
jgi:hypothetical protein